MNTKKFIYQKRQTVNDSGTNYEWYLLYRKDGVANGVHFHGVVYKDLSPALSYYTNRHGFATYGIEIHSDKPKYEGDNKPLPNCFVTGGDCYCDGTSLYARERLGHINPDGSNDSEIWFVLEDFYANKFERKDDE